MVSASVLLIVLSAAVASSLYQQAGARRSVLEVTQAISLGKRISAQDLTDVRISLSGGLAAVPASESRRVIGRRSGVTIPQGSLLVWGDVSQSSGISPGYALVGVSLRAGQVPAAGVESGEMVEVVLVPPAGQPVGSSVLEPAGGVAGSSQQGGGVAGSAAGYPQGGAPTPGQSSNGFAYGGSQGSIGGVVLVARAAVFGVHVPQQSTGLGGSQLASSASGEAVSLVVPLVDAALVAAAATQGQIAIVVVGSRPAVPSSASSQGLASGRHGVSR